MLNKINQAYKRIKKVIRETTLEFNHAISEKTGAKVFLKTENTQVSGSFKYRGVLSKLSYLKAFFKRFFTNTSSYIER